MANNRFNKQVTPKGYKMGGKVMGDRVGFDKGMGVKETGYKHKGKLEKEYKKIIGKDRKLRDPEDALMALTRTDVGVKFLDGLEKKGINTKKIREDILKEKMKSKEFKKGGRVARKMGGSLKAVQPNQKGLKKLPTEVRNKMGFMKKGGMVPNEKYIKKVAKELRKK